MAVWRPVLARAAVVWVPLAAAIAGVSVLVYAAAQSDLRSAANDPQIEMVEDAASSLDSGAAPASVVPSASVEMATSLHPYLLVFDRAGHVIAASVTLHGAAPDFPTSVFDGVTPRGQDRITWQPEPGVRSAAVVQRWRGGYVVGGRSLRLTEEREAGLELLVTACCFAALAATGVAAVLVGIIHPLPGRPSSPSGEDVGGDRRGGAVTTARRSGPR